TMRSALAVEGIWTKYRTLEPSDIAMDHYFELLSAGDPAAPRLAEYLNQFHRLTLPDMRPAEREGHEIGLAVASEGRPDDLLGLVAPLVRAVMGLGWRSVVFVEGEPAFWIDGTPPVIVGSRHSIHRLAYQFRHRCALSSDLVNAQFARD